ACRDLRQERSTCELLTDPSHKRYTLKPPDVFVFWISWRETCVSGFGVSPLLELSSRGFTVGQIALKAASCKVTKHEKTCIENQHMFIPFAFDTFGFLAPEAVKLLNSVQRAMNMELEKQLLIVIGDVDPVCIVARVRKIGKIAEIVTVGPPKKPDPPKPNAEPCKDLCKIICPNPWPVCNDVYGPVMVGYSQSCDG
ncbi:hypothetical protein Tco_0897725, partial [Tanacetum coccineum]